MTASILSVVRIGSRMGGSDWERGGAEDGGSLSDSNLSSSTLKRCSVLFESSCTVITSGMITFLEIFSLGKSADVAFFLAFSCLLFIDANERCLSSSLSA